jgi:hypothetical protein
MRHLAIINTHPTVVTIDAEVDARDVDGNTVVLDESLITQEITRLQLAYESNKYQRDRVLEYPSIGDQLDMIYHSGIGGTEFQAAIKAVKDAHPKGGN